MRLLPFLLKKNKPKKNLAAHTTFSYGTHLPVLQSILEVFAPRGILELGAGKVSTLLFHQYGNKVLSIETNERWFQELTGTLPARENFSLIHHDLRPITERTRIDAIPHEVKEDCVRYYRALMAQNPELDFLFIDHVSGLRAFTLAALYLDFDFVVYHDAEDKGYGYDLFSTSGKDNYSHFVLRSLVPYTGLLIHKRFAGRLAEFKRVLDRHTQEYFALQYRFDLQELDSRS
jgi:hypothetical protein